MLALQMHWPVDVLHAWPEAHAAQAPPPVPHSVLVCEATATHVPLLQQPVAHEAALQVHWPVEVSTSGPRRRPRRQRLRCRTRRSSRSRAARTRRRRSSRMRTRSHCRRTRRWPCRTSGPRRTPRRPGRRCRTRCSSRLPAVRTSSRSCIPCTCGWCRTARPSRPHPCADRRSVGRPPGATHRWPGTRCRSHNPSRCCCRHQCPWTYRQGTSTTSSAPPRRSCSWYPRAPCPGRPMSRRRYPRRSRARPSLRTYSPRPRHHRYEPVQRVHFHGQRSFGFLN